MTDSLSEAARNDCVEQVHRSLRRSALLGIPASSLLVLLLGNKVPVSTRVAFVCLVAASDVLTFALSSICLRRRASGRSIAQCRLGPVGPAVTGLAWASLAVMALPHGQLRVVYLLFVLGTSATYVVATAARKSYYFAAQLPMLSVLTVVYVVSDDRVTRMLGFAIPLYFLVMTSLFYEVHNLFVSERQLREENEEAGDRLRDANAELTRRALRDPLTGLANRTGFMERLEAAVQQSQKTGKAICVLYLDIDRFKLVNDSLGHATGDALLRIVAARLRTVMDRASAFARLGGDEFTVLVENIRDDDEAREIASRIARTFDEVFDVDGRRIHATTSIGVATNTYTDDDGERLLSLADAAQYRAKQCGRNRTHLCDFSLRLTLARRIDDEEQLRDAIAREEFAAWFQPEVDLALGEIVGAEALARWVHPTRGILSAHEFIPVAEDTGLILDVDECIVRNAIEARALLARHRVPESFRIWCNISPRELARSRPTNRLLALLERIGCPPHLIGIEITETAVLPDMKAAGRELAAAREAGIKVALDDFGTGYSSMTLLRSLPIDKLKIDRTFVEEFTQDPRAAAIVRRVLGLARDLGLDVAAEGVETRAQAELLQSLGCSKAQGFLWAGALPVEELTKRLEQGSVDDDVEHRGVASGVGGSRHSEAEVGAAVVARSAGPVERVAENAS